MSTDPEDDVFALLALADRLHLLVEEGVDESYQGLDLELLGRAANLLSDQELLELEAKLPDFVFSDWLKHNLGLLLEGQRALRSLNR